MWACDWYPDQTVMQILREPGGEWLRPGDFFVEQWHSMWGRIWDRQMQFRKPNCCRFFTGVALDGFLPGAFPVELLVGCLWLCFELPGGFSILDSAGTAGHVQTVNRLTPLISQCTSYACIYEKCYLAL